MCLGRRSRARDDPVRPRQPFEGFETAFGADDYLARGAESLPMHPPADGNLLISVCSAAASDPARTPRTS